MIREYKDVIRIEVGKNALDGLLREQQLGFETIPSGTGSASIVRMGYKDSNGNVRYFTEDAGVKAGYWSPGQWGGIYYNEGRVAVGAEPGSDPEFGAGAPKFEIRSSETSQTRMSYSDSTYADVGIDSKGQFAIYIKHNNISNQSYLELSEDVFRVFTKELHLSHYGNRLFFRVGSSSGKNVGDLWLQTNGNGGNIKLDAGYGGGVEFLQGSSSFSRFMYTNNNESLLNIERGYNLRIRTSNNGGIILEPSQYDGVQLAAYRQASGGVIGVGKWSYSDNNLSFETLVSNNNIKLKTTNGGQGNVILEPGATGWVEAMNLFKLPVRTDEPEGQNALNGCIYFNPGMGGSGSVRICRNGVWQTLFS